MGRSERCTPESNPVRQASLAVRWSPPSLALVCPVEVGMTRENQQDLPKQSRRRRILKRVAVVPRKPDFSRFFPYNKPPVSRKR